MNCVKKYVKIMLSIALIFGSLTTVCFARNIGEFSDFSVKTYSWSKTSPETKVHNNGSYVVNLTETKRGQIIRHCITNSDGKLRSEIKKMYTGDRETNETWGQAGYYYYLEMQRGGYNPKEIRVYGSWSPDNEN